MTLEKNTTELEAAYQKFLRLYERLSADRLIISKQGETLGKVIEELKVESTLATEFKVQLRQDVVTMLKQTAAEMGAQIKSAIQEPITNELNDAIKNLKTALNASSEALSESTRAKNKNIVVKCLAIVSGICLATLIVINIWLRHLYFTGDQMATYHDGVVLRTFWNKLDKSNQTYLQKLGRGEKQPQENSIEWIKQQHPELDDTAVWKKFNEKAK